MMSAFATKTGIPLGQVDLSSNHTQATSWAGQSSILSELGSIQVTSGD